MGRGRTLVAACLLFVLGVAVGWGLGRHYAAPPYEIVQHGFAQAIFDKRTGSIWLNENGRWKEVPGPP